MTTDTRSKEAVVSRDGFTVGGMAKGSGMIHPDLATMLAVVTTDYPLEPGEAIEFLRPAVETSFNAISVDGEPSTNDCVILLANGASGAPRERRGVRGGARRGLRRPGAAGGRRRRGHHRARRDQRHRAPSTTTRRKAIARRIATSPLVKTALFGHDANWGRVLMAAGSRALERRLRDRRRRAESRSSTTAPSSSTRARRPTSSPTSPGPSCTIDLDLGLGSGKAGYLTSDLSYDYVRINADYRT